MSLCETRSVWVIQVLLESMAEKMELETKRKQAPVFIHEVAVERSSFADIVNILDTVNINFHIDISFFLGLFTFFLAFFAFLLLGLLLLDLIFVSTSAGIVLLAAQVLLEGVPFLHLVLKPLAG